MDPQLSTKKMAWMEHSLDMKPPGFWENPVNLCLSLHVDIVEEAVNDEDTEQLATKIKHAKCKKADRQHGTC
jgi:hypothetical protein